MTARHPGARLRALVTGATGLVGSALMSGLVARSEYGAIETIGRRPPELVAQKLKHRIADLASPDLAGALIADAFFCCLGTTIKTAGSQAAFRHVDYDMVVNLARQACSAGTATFIVVSSLGADPKSSNFYQRTKGEMEEAVESIGFDRLAILRPSLLLGGRDESRPVEALSQAASRLFNPLLLGGLAKFRSIDAVTVANAMIALDLSDFKGTRILESDEIARLGST